MKSRDLETLGIRFILAAGLIIIFAMASGCSNFGHAPFVSTFDAEQEGVSGVFADDAPQSCSGINNIQPGSEFENIPNGVDDKYSACKDTLMSSTMYIKGIPDELYSVVCVVPVLDVGEGVVPYPTSEGDYAKRCLSKSSIQKGEFVSFGAEEIPPENAGFNSIVVVNQADLANLFSCMEGNTFCPFYSFGQLALYNFSNF